MKVATVGEVRAWLEVLKDDALVAVDLWTAADVLFADNMRNLLAEGEMKSDTFLDHLRRLQERFGADAEVAYCHKHHCRDTVSGIIERIHKQRERLGSEGGWVEFDDWVDPFAVLAYASAAGHELTDAEAIEAVGSVADLYNENGKPDDTAAWIKDAINYTLGLD